MSAWTTAREGDRPDRGARRRHQRAAREVGGSGNAFCVRRHQKERNMCPWEFRVTSPVAWKVLFVKTINIVQGQAVQWVDGVGNETSE